MDSIPFPVTRRGVRPLHDRLTLEAATFRLLFESFGPSLGLWRAAEISALRRRAFPRPTLDLGCGDGLVTSLVLPRVDIGLDPWPQAIERAGARGVYARLERAPVEACMLPSARVRTIVSNSVLEHLSDIPAVLCATARLLMPGGRLIFTVPTEAFPKWLLLPASRYGAWRNRSYDHRNLWSIDEWRRRLDAAGFEVEEVQPYLRRAQVAAWDGLELAQRVWIGRHRLFGELWKRLPPGVLAVLARLASRVDLSAPPPGGGRLIVARRVAG